MYLGSRYANDNFEFLCFVLFVIDSYYLIYSLYFFFFFVTADNSSLGSKTHLETIMFPGSR